MPSDLHASTPATPATPTAPGSPPARGRWLVATTEYAGLTPYTGGIGRHYASLLPALVRQGAAVDLLVLAGGDLLSDADLGGVRLVGHVRPPRARVPALLARAAAVRRAYRAGAHDRVFLPEWAALGVALPAGAPLLTNLATSTRLANEVAGFTPRSFGVRGGAVVAVQSRLEDRQVRRSAGLVPISGAMQRWTERAFPVLPPARVVRNCIDVDHVRRAAGSAGLPAGWPDDGAPVVLFLGRLERRKGVTDAFAAFAEVARRHPTARLVLAGASGDRRFEPDRPALLRLLPPEARDRVTWLGHVDDDTLYRAVREAAVTTCPSRWEGFGNAALEAKALGGAVVVTTGSGYDDFCTDGDDSLMVPPADPAALAEAVLRLLDDPVLAATLGARAAAGAGRWTADPVAADLLDAADALLGPPGAGAARAAGRTAGRTAE
ncbi:glycosyltransferase family 4 protein [Cellulomonas sp. ACRRI]|uniref:glycosyltransferase family 4 protein n=1 Tax=Cellulomonas sp. ACRRI TaxID=2918188 RepID=UPI001EF3895A|nr:glycosyltransferase family 4 protein [Cellulomonas sp. ACRRI]MCG7285808.1 glycosyltransferase family 4 protein [Cellulomonas sp. ACRRI]